MKIYLTTHFDARAVFCCRLWSEEPVRAKGPYGGVWKDGKLGPLLTRRPATIEYCAALGFPPPGEMRIVEIGEYKEEE